jgi:hypothetical protein
VEAAEVALEQGLLLAQLDAVAEVEAPLRISM